MGMTCNYIGAYEMFAFGFFAGLVYALAWTIFMDGKRGQGRPQWERNRWPRKR